MTPARRSFVFRCCALVLALACACDSQPTVVTTLAGNGSGAFADGIGTNARFKIPSGVAVDSSGNVYIADTGNNRIRFITPTGTVTTLAGSGSGAFADGIGTNARFKNPIGVAVDSSGNVYITDTGNNRTRFITPTYLPPLAAPLRAVGTLMLAPIAPPPPAPPPYPPGVTPATLLAVANAAKKGNRMVVVNEAAARGAAYAIAGLVVLWLPVQAMVHAVQAAYKRRTAVTAALAIHIDGGGPGSGGTNKLDGAADAEGEGEEDELHGRRFGAPKLAAALVDILATESSTAAATDLLHPPQRPMLRPLLRTPLMAALGDKAGTNASVHLAARKKPASLVWRLKRFIASELHWQAREMRHAMRALRRCGGGSRDPVGKAFRAVPSSRSGGSGAVLVEVTWRFGWKGRSSAACWRWRLRDSTQLAALEAAIAAGLAVRPLEVLAVQQHNVGDSAVVLALLDDEPHANLDKKLKARQITSLADPETSQMDENGVNGRSPGVAPAVAARLEAVLALCALKPGRAGEGSPNLGDEEEEDAPVSDLAPP